MVNITTSLRLIKNHDPPIMDMDSPTSQDNDAKIETLPDTIEIAW